MLRAADAPWLQATWDMGYWANDMDHVCFQGWHLALSLALGLPSLLVLGAGIPVLFAYMLWRHRHTLDDADTREKLGFAYRSYKWVLPAVHWTVSHESGCEAYQWCAIATVAA